MKVPDISKNRFLTLTRRLYIFVVAVVLLAVVMPANAGTWSIKTVSGIVQVAYGSGTNYPQYGAFYLDSSYYRLNPGPGSSWGTSLILNPAYWSGGTLHQGGTMTLASNTITNSNEVLKFNGTIGALSTQSVVTIYPPENNAVSALVQVWVTGSVKLDNKPGQAFKPIQLSSMYESNDYFDSWQVLLDSGPIYYNPAGGWIELPPL